LAGDALVNKIRSAMCLQLSQRSAVSPMIEGAWEGWGGEVLLFAGEHTSGTIHGTTHGAWLSGLRAAEMLWDLR